MAAKGKKPELRPQKRRGYRRRGKGSDTGILQSARKVTQLAIALSGNLISWLQI